MRVLVTGASGFVGRALLSRLPHGYEAVAVTRRIPDWAASVPSAEWIELDLALPGFQSRLPKDVDATVHLAQSRFDRQFPTRADDVVDVNVASTARLLDHAREARAGRFVLASTATVYRQASIPLDEGAPLDLSSFYASTKRAAEMLAQAYASEVPVTALRIFTTYGAGQRGRLVAELIERVKTGQAVTVQGDRGLVLSPVHVGDVADALLAACGGDGDGFEVLNVGGAEALGIAQMAAEIGRALGREAVLERRPSSEPGGFVANIDRMKGRFPELHPVSFREGLRLTLEGSRDP